MSYIQAKGLFTKEISFC